MNPQNGYNSVPAMQAPVMDAYQQHRDAAQEFHEACNRFQEAAARRASAEKSLQVATEKLQQIVQVAAQDPTVPPQAEMKASRY